MSNLDRAPSLAHCTAATATHPVREVFQGREVALGAGTTVRRLLPNLGRRLVGPWCFVDHYGPDDVAQQPGMRVPPHPHMGLQTVSWLLAGEVHHCDSLGNSAVIRPGELGLMSAGHAIAHAEHSPDPHTSFLHGVQLWVALPSPARDTAPSWEHHRDLPVLTAAGLTLTVILGTMAGSSSAGTVHSPTIGASLALGRGAEALVPLEPDFEHALLALSGSVDVDGVELRPGALLYLGTARRDLALRSSDGAQVLLLGGEPFAEQIVMWWNFVARSNEEIVHARTQWTASERFGAVAGAGTRLAAPPLPPGTLKAGGAVR